VRIKEKLPEPATSTLPRFEPALHFIDDFSCVALDFELLALAGVEQHED